MDLTTRCPQCGATFSASLEQLQLRKGYIRCPNCAHIFDGFDAVVPSGGQAPGPAPRPAPPRPVPGPDPAPGQGAAARPGPAAALPHVVRQRTESSIHGSRSEPAFTISGEQRQAGPHAEPTVSLPVGDSLPPRVQTSRAPYVGRPVVDDDETSGDGVREAASGSDGHTSFGVYVEPRAGESAAAPEPDFLDPLPARHRGFGFYFWGLLSVLGVALFLAQCLYVYRGQIAASLPAVRPLLERACVSLHCRVPYSRDIGEITIMNSSLQISTSPPDASGTSAATPPAGAMVLRVTLRNGLDKPQEWPTLVLDLLDFSGTVVVKKDLPPAAYLPPDLARRPFAAHSEVTALVPITMNDVKVSGFQLAKYFS